MWISTTSAESGVTTRFIGAGNYQSLISDARFLRDILNTSLYVVLAAAIELLAGLGLALILTQNLRGVKIFRGIFLAPMMLPPIVVGYLYVLLFEADRGGAVYLLSFLGKNIDWRINPSTAPFAIVAVDAWQWIPFMMIILLAGLQSLPVDPQEAALIDGASSWGVFRYVKLPMLLPVIIVALVLRAIDLFKLFDIVTLLTGGGPGGVTETLNLYVYQLSRVFFRYGYAAATGTAMLIMLSIVFTLFLRARRR